MYSKRKTARKKAAAENPVAEKPAVEKPTAQKSARKTKRQNPEYSDDSFWSIARKSFKAIGETTLTQALTLYHTLKDDDTPSAARMVIVGALAYLILPTDIIPDFIPLVGFTDDAGAIAAAALTVASKITAEHKRKAAKQVKDIFS